MVLLKNVKKLQVGYKRVMQKCLQALAGKDSKISTCAGLKSYSSFNDFFSKSKFISSSFTEKKRLIFEIFLLAKIF